MAGSATSSLRTSVSPPRAGAITELPRVLSSGTLDSIARELPIVRVGPHSNIAPTSWIADIEDFDVLEYGDHGDVD